MNKNLQDTIIRLSNANSHLFSETHVLKSKLIISFLKCLYNEGFIRGFVVGPRNIKAYLKYFDNKPAIKHISSVSKLSKRVYISKSEILSLLSSKEVLILTTSSGLATSKTILNGDFKGGEVLARVY